jgi:hypothetical protein
LPGPETPHTYQNWVPNNKPHESNPDIYRRSSETCGTTEGCNFRRRCASEFSEFFWGTQNSNSQHSSSACRIHAQNVLETFQQASERRFKSQNNLKEVFSDISMEGTTSSFAAFSKDLFSAAEDQFDSDDGDARSTEGDGDEYYGLDSPESIGELRLGQNEVRGKDVTWGRSTGGADSLVQQGSIISDEPGNNTFQ